MQWLNRYIKAFGEDRFEALLPEITWNGLFQANGVGRAMFLEAYTQRRNVYREAEDKLEHLVPRHRGTIDKRLL